MKMVNVSEMSVHYEWSFLEDELNAGGETSEAQTNRTMGIPINEVFDILPLNGTLEPNQSEQVEFVYYGVPNQKFKTIAVCQVEGGPEYEVNLLGEASNINYRLNIQNANNIIDFGEIPFSGWNHREFVIENLGKVPFEYQIRMDNIIRKGLIQVSPQQGKIASGDKPKITISFCPALPGDYTESFKIQVAHFEPETITLRGYGLYPAIKLELDATLHRVKTPDFRKRLEEDNTVQYPIDDEDEQRETWDKNLDNDIVSEIDRRILSDAIMKNIDSKDQGNMSVDSSYADFRSENKKENAAGQHDTTGLGQTQNLKENMTERSGFTRAAPARFEKRLIEKVVVGTYTLDFGNVVAGLKKEVQFKMWNVGKMPFNLQFDQKNIKSAGFTLSHDKIARFNYKDNNWITLKILYQTRKNSPPGKAKYILPIEISNGPRYLLEIITNVTVPDISVSSNDIDFGAVICGMKKTMYIRFENQKEVPCIWTLNLKEERTVAHEREKKGEPRFTMTQTSGTMPKYTKSTIEISFVPIAEKSYQQKFMIEITDNTRKCEIVCRGFGVTPNLEFFPPEMIFAPSLPYDEKV
jgi:hydrocephalus-inducing protein